MRKEKAVGHNGEPMKWRGQKPTLGNEIESMFTHAHLGTVSMCKRRGGAGVVKALPDCIVYDSDNDQLYTEQQQHNLISTSVSQMC